MDAVAEHAKTNIAAGECVNINQRIMQARDEACEQECDIEDEISLFADPIEEESCNDKSSAGLPFKFEYVCNDNSLSDDGEDNRSASISASLTDSNYLILVIPSVTLTELSMLAITVNQLKDMCQWNKLAISRKKSAI